MNIWIYFKNKNLIEQICLYIKRMKSSQTNIHTYWRPKLTDVRWKIKDEKSKIKDDWHMIMNNEIECWSSFTLLVKNDSVSPKSASFWCSQYWKKCLLWHPPNNINSWFPNETCLNVFFFNPRIKFCLFHLGASQTFILVY